MRTFLFIYFFRKENGKLSQAAQECTKRSDQNTNEVSYNSNNNKKIKPTKPEHKRLNLKRHTRALLHGFNTVNPLGRSTGESR